MEKYILKLLEKEVNQLKAILRKLEYELQTNPKLPPVIEKTKSKLLIAEGHLKKFISVNNCVSSSATHHELDLEFVKQQGGIPQDNENEGY